MIFCNVKGSHSFWVKMRSQMMELIGYEKRKYETNLITKRLNAVVIAGRKEKRRFGGWSGERGGRPEMLSRGNKRIRSR